MVMRLTSEGTHYLATCCCTWKSMLVTVTDINIYITDIIHHLI